MRFRKLAFEQMQDRVMMAADVSFGYGNDFFSDPNDGISVMMDWHYDLQPPVGSGADGYVDLSVITLD